MAGRSGSLFFWRDRTREVDFLIDMGGRFQLYEAKWAELPAEADTVNLAFVRNILGESAVSGGGILCRAPNAYPLRNGFRVLPIPDLT